jgi:peptide chain release factor subunit 1
MRANDVEEARLRRLAEARDSQDTVLSVFVDLDPTTFATPRGRTSELDSLLDEAHRRIEDGERPHRELMALRAAHERAREILTEEDSWARGGLGVALFVCEPLELEELLRLPHPLASGVVISDIPFIGPLTATGPAGRGVCVALLDERHARILRGSDEALEEAVSFGDPVHGRHDQGGWSQPRYQRSQEHDVDEHIKHVARTLLQMLHVDPYERLIVACTRPLFSLVLERLHPEVRRLLHDEPLSLEITSARPADVERAVAPVLAAERAAHIDDALAELREHLAREGDPHAAAGLSDVLPRLVERRVATLLYETTLRAEGALCPRCGWMALEPGECPVDGTELERREQIVEDALHAAVEQDAEILPLRDRPELGPLGGIAARLRF